MRKYLIITLLFLISIFYYISCSAIHSSSTDIEYLIKRNKGNVYQKDFLYLIQKLKEIHPAFTPNDYAYVYDDDFKKLACEIYSDLGKSPFKEGESESNIFKFCYLATKLLSKIKDGHSYFSHTNVFNSPSEPTIPIIMKWFGNELYIVDVMDNYEFLINKKVTKIGSIDVEEIKPQFDDFISGDNEYFKNNINGLILCRKNVLELLNLVSYNKVEIEYIDNGEIKTEILELKKWKGYKRKVENFFKGNIGRKEEFFNENSAEIWYREIKEYSVIYVQSNTFNPGSYFELQFKNLLEEVKEKGIKNIIIDLRSNIGGDASSFKGIMKKYLCHKNTNSLSSYFVLIKPVKEGCLGFGINPDDCQDEIENGDLYSFMDGNMKPDIDKDLAFNGNLYIFIGGMSVSAATNFACIIKDNKLGTLIGEPTGTSSVFFHGSHITSALLPNVITDVGISFSIDVRANEEARLAEPDAVYPDVYVPTTFEDYINGKDPCWEYLVENVFNKQ